jgi:hypothetical protein
MSTPINKSFELPCDLSSAIRMMSDESSLDRLMEFSFAQNPKHSVEQTSDGGLKIHIFREFEGEWPGFLEAIIGKTLKIDETRLWQRAIGNVREGVTEISAPGLPVEVNAEMKIVENAGQCVVSIDGHVKVNLPFVGSKVEQMVLDQMTDAIDVEAKFYLEELKKLQ